MVFSKGQSRFLVRGSGSGGTSLIISSAIWHSPHQHLPSKGRGERVTTDLVRELSYAGPPKLLNNPSTAARVAEPLLGHDAFAVPGQPYQGP